MSDKKERAKALTVLSVRIIQSTTSSILSPDLAKLEKTRKAIIKCLWDIKDRKRKDLLQLLAHNDAAFLRAFDLPPESYAQIAQSIIDICTRWEWL